MLERRHLLPETDFGVQHRIAELAGDHPYYVQCIGDRLRLWGSQQPITQALTEAAFYAELSQPGGSIHLHCEYLINVSLERARYHAVLRGLLDVLSSGGPQTISTLPQRAPCFSSSATAFSASPASWEWRWRPTCEKRSRAH